jgi:uncharacterized metal-binding protein
MKYIISESRFESLISNYLDDSLKNIESHIQEIEGEEYNWWGIEDVPVFVLKNVYGKIGIAYDEQYVSSLCDLFGISENESKKYILQWINSTLNVHPDFIIQQEMF